MWQWGTPRYIIGNLPIRQVIGVLKGLRDLPGIYHGTKVGGVGPIFGGDADDYLPSDVVMVICILLTKVQPRNWDEIKGEITPLAPDGLQRACHLSHFNTIYQVTQQSCRRVAYLSLALHMYS